MASEDQVERTPHGGTRIRASVPERRPVIEFDATPQEAAGSHLPADAMAPAPTGIDPARALPHGTDHPDTVPPTPPTDVHVHASPVNVPMFDTRALLATVREGTRTVLDRVRSNGEASVPADEDASPDPEPEAGTEQASTGFQVLRYGPPRVEDEGEADAAENPSTTPVRLPRASLQRPPAPPADATVQATTPPSPEDASSPGLLARLRARLPGGSADGRAREPEAPPQPEPAPEPASHEGQGDASRTARQPNARPPVPTDPIDQETMEAVPDDADDEDSQTSDASPGFLSRMTSRFSRDDPPEGDGGDTREEPTSEGAPENTGEAAPAASTGDEADDADEEEDKEGSGFLSRLKGRFSSKDETDQGDEPDGEPASQTPEDDVPPQDPETLPPENDTTGEDDPQPDEDEGQAPPDEGRQEDEPEPALEEPLEATDREDEGQAPQPGQPVDPDQARPTQPNEGHAPTPPAAEADQRVPAHPAGSTTSSREPVQLDEPDEPQAENEQAPEPGDDAEPGDEDAEPEPTGEPESQIDPEELHETVDEVLDRYRERPPRLLEERRRT